VGFLKVNKMEKSVANLRKSTNRRNDKNNNTMEIKFENLHDIIS
jgi:hypothetical protein